LYGDEPEAFGFALAAPGALTPELAVGQLPLDNWSALIAGRSQKPATISPARLNDTAVELARVSIAGGATPLVLWAAFDPIQAFALLDGDAHVSSALVGPDGHVLAGEAALAQQSKARGYSDAQNDEGTTLLALRRGLAGTPWQLVVARPLPTLPANTLLTIALGSALVALVAGVLAFGISAWRLRPLLDLAEAARRLAAGDFSVRMPARDARDEVQTLSRAFNEMASQLDAQRRALEERNQELLRANEVLEQLSITDGLTHMHNHRHFHDQFGREVKRADRSGQPLCLLLVDIDDFKHLNDRHGHALGDRVLAETAQLVNSQVRQSDYLARYGGEEFALLLPQTALDGAVALAEKIRAAIAEHTFALPDFSASVRVTVSVGVAQYANSTDETFDAADRALYDAKAAGKDCVIAAAAVDRARAPWPKRRR
jgi:diguanylate cyclase (GGDEF)-like protein